jgi:hypothetical protein
MLGSGSLFGVKWMRGGEGMDPKKEMAMRKGLAMSVQKALRKHRVDPDNLGETASFLANILGGMIGVIFPQNRHEKEVQSLKGDIEYGIEMGVPEE